MSAPRLRGRAPGWDAGTAVQAESEGSDPSAGAPVVPFGSAAGRARLRAVDTAFLVAIPAEADPGSGIQQIGP